MTRTQLCQEALREFFASRPHVLGWGIAPARKTPNADLLRNWVDQGRNGTMAYMANNVQARMDPQILHSWAESAVMFMFPYARSLEPSRTGYRLSAYAGMVDYHDEARAILRDAQAFLSERISQTELPFYGFVDTAPVFERDLASEAGLGWRGKNCCTLNRNHGSAFHLAGFLLDIPLPSSTPLEEFCGGCTRCIDQCPTEAFLGPGQLDANKCISYWTIEAKGELPKDLTEKFGGWIFGCDICQDVCPWNHKHIRSEPKENKSLPFPSEGAEWLNLLRKGGGFQSRYKRSPLARAGRKSMLRNLAVAAANLKDIALLPQLLELYAQEEDSILRKEIENAILRLKATQASQNPF
jgi:epoxyqueuosine reductase